MKYLYRSKFAIGKYLNHDFVAKTPFKINVTITIPKDTMLEPVYERNITDIIVAIDTYTNVLINSESSRNMQKTIGCEYITLVPLNTPIII